jgi:tetratricopeptide (TPR) repeat protein
MRKKAVILILLFMFLVIPVVHAEDAAEWNIKAQNAAAAGNFAEAITYYNNALALDKKSATAMAGKAAALNQLGKYTEAVILSESALAIRSSDPVALNARAFGLFKLQQYDEAVTAYDNLFAVQSNNRDAYCNQGYAYLQVNKSDAAAASYGRCAAMDPLNVDAWNNQGLAYLQGGKYTAALAAFDKATALTVRNAQVWNNKGLAYVALGKPQDALTCFNKALGIDPKFEDAAKNKADVTGKLQLYNSTRTATPTVTISRIGTFYTTAMPVQESTPVITALPETPGENVVPVTATTVARRTTYAPISPVMSIGALVVIAGLAVVMQRKKE